MIDRREFIAGVGASALMLPDTAHALIGSRRAAVLSQGVGAAFDPLSLAPTALWDISVLSSLWQDSARSIPVTAALDPVGCVDDLSGHGYHLVQPTASKRPVYHASGGKFWVSLDGVDDTMSCAVASSGSEVTLIAAVKAAAQFSSLYRWQGVGFIVLPFSFGGTENFITSATGESYNTLVFPGHMSDGGPHVIAGRRKKAVIFEARTDGVSAAIVAANQNNPAISTMYLGSNQGASEFMAGSFYGGAVFMGAYLSDQDMRLMEKWAAGKNGATVP